MKKLLFLVFLFNGTVHSSVNFRTSFGQCPSRTSGSFALRVMKDFERFKSLRLVKDIIVEENLMEKHFISDYKFKFDPSIEQLKIKLDCPKPLFKVHVLKDDKNSYDAVLVDSGKLFDPTYEEVLKSEKKLNHKLPFLSVPVSKIDTKIQDDISQLFGKTEASLLRSISEVVIDGQDNMTIILSLNEKPVTTFIGKENWTNKVKKLSKMVTFFKEKKQLPALINLTNEKKVVVKFSDKI